MPSRCRIPRRSHRSTGPAARNGSRPISTPSGSRFRASATTSTRGKISSGFAVESWFKPGDRDIGLHLVPTQGLRAGEPLSHVTARIATAVGVETTILPATDDRLRTWVETPSGTFSFQQWFVARAHRDPVDRLRFEGSADARPAPGVLDALHEADAILIPPSNPYLSIGPILAVERIRRAIERRRVPCVAVRPLIGGRALKGPG